LVAKEPGFGTSERWCSARIRQRLARQLAAKDSERYPTRVLVVEKPEARWRKAFRELNKDA
jgi:hypothetical protein